MTAKETVFFDKTLKLLRQLNLEFNVANELDIDKNPNEFYLMLSEYLKSSACLGERDLERINEILEIEKQKLTLRNSKEEVDVIFNIEIDLCRKRDLILSNPIELIFNKNFVLNPQVKIYESYWEWIVPEFYNESLDFHQILKSEKGDYYFIFQQTGTYDSLSKSNILEFPLTDYHYFILCQFEKPSKILSVIKTFQKEFDVDTYSEITQLKNITEKMIKELIFKMLIVEYSNL